MNNIDFLCTLPIGFWLSIVLFKQVRYFLIFLCGFNSTCWSCCLWNRIVDFDGTFLKFALGGGGGHPHETWSRTGDQTPTDGPEKWGKSGEAPKCFSSGFQALDFGSAGFTWASPKTVDWLWADHHKSWTIKRHRGDTFWCFKAVSFVSPFKDFRRHFVFANHPMLTFVDGACVMDIFVVALRIFWKGCSYKKLCTLELAMIRLRTMMFYGGNIPTKTSFPVWNLSELRFRDEFSRAALRDVSKWTGFSETHRSQKHGLNMMDPWLCAEGFISGAGNQHEFGGPISPMFHFDLWPPNLVLEGKPQGLPRRPWHRLVPWAAMGKKVGWKILGDGHTISKIVT